MILKVFSLPPPKELSFQEKKQHINIIIKNFLELAKKVVLKMIIITTTTTTTVAKMGR